MEEERKGGFSYKVGSSENFMVSKIPTITTTNKGVLYFNYDGEDNAMPDALFEKYSVESSVHSNMINLKKNMIYGEGFVPVSPNPSAQEFLDQINKQGDNWNDMLEKWSLDMAVMEAIAIELIYNSSGQIANAYQIPVSFVRAEKVNALGYSENFYISREWADITNKANRRASEKTRAIKVAAFNPATWEKDGAVQMIYAKRYNPTEFYAIPSYFSAIPYIDLQWELAKFNLNKLQKGMMATGILTFNGDPSDQEKNTFIRDFQSKYIGASKDKILYVWTTSEEQKPTWTPIQANEGDDTYESLIKISNEAISLAHGGSTALIGIEADGVNFGDGGKLAIATAVFNKNIISPMQNVILSAVNKIFEHNGLGKVTIPYIPLDQEVSSDVPVTDPAQQASITKQLKVN